LRRSCREVAGGGEGESIKQKSGIEFCVESWKLRFVGLKRISWPPRMCEKILLRSSGGSLNSGEVWALDSVLCGCQ
jgi:hypothetical protein